VGIFSLFGKKDGQQPPQSDRDAARKKRSATQTHGPVTTTRIDGKPTTTSPQIVQRKVAGQATALKIDAIESEMSSEFMKYSSSSTPNSNTIPEPPPQTFAGKASNRIPVSTQPTAIGKTEPATDATTSKAPSGRLGPATIAGTTTQMLMSETYGGCAVALSVSETLPIIEEAAILYANGQTRAAEQMLQQTIGENLLGDAAMTVWNMLFDLYLVTGRRDEFEQLSIAFANKFETSPPAWVDLTDQRQAAAVGASAIPVVHFPTKLDNGIAKQLERVQNLAANHRTLRLEFARVTEVTPVGCGILLHVLTRLQKSGNDLILVGSHELADKIRAIIEVGRRDETEAPWLLLLEILRLLNLEKEFEETSIDYCVTFEVSPPTFVAPQNKVTTAIAEMPEPKTHNEQFVMPRVIEGKTDDLVKTIAAYAKDHKSAVIDCTRLVRVDFGAAGQLLTGLAPLVADSTQIELHNVNHLVLALFRIIGLSDLVRILPRKL
jgi:ABC-type transporter Mla MlaB component